MKNSFYWWYFCVNFTAGCSNGPAETPTPNENAEETPMPEEPADLNR